MLLPDAVHGVKKNVRGKVKRRRGEKGKRKKDEEDLILEKALQLFGAKMPETKAAA